MDWRKVLIRIWFVVRIVATVYWLALALGVLGIIDVRDPDRADMVLACIAVAFFLWSGPPRRDGP